MIDRLPERSLVGNLVSLLRPWRVRVAFVALAVLAAAAFELLPPLVIRTVVDAHLVVGRTDGLLLLALLYLGASAAVQAMTFVSNYLAATVAQHVLSELRVRLFAHVGRLPTSYFDRVPMGDIVSRATADVETLDMVFSSNVSTLIANLARLGTIMVAMVALSVPLSVVAALVVPPLALVTRFLQVRVRQAERENRVAVGDVNARLLESLRGAEVIRAFGREPEFVAGFRRVLSRGLAASNRSSVYSSLYMPMTAILSALAVAALLTIGTQHALMRFGISLGTLTAFVMLVQRFLQPIAALGEEWQTVQGAMAGAERIFGTLALPADRTDDGGGATADGAIARVGDDATPRRSGAQHGVAAAPVALRHVEFGYTDGEPVLRDVSLDVRRGEQVALVGRTGAGKTSALHLAAGLYRPWQGTVRIAGADPTVLEDSARRGVLGVVPQVVQIFSGTVMDNLTLGDTAVPETLVYEACRIAGADAFVRALPAGYRTELRGTGSGRGAQLSAGQQQLLALARALVHQPAALLFDEATAAIDSASDAAFRAALRSSVVTRGAGVLTIAHRLSTALDADRVIVLEKGRIVEEGPPAELAARGGRFAALLELEAAGWDWRTSS